MPQSPKIRTWDDIVRSETAWNWRELRDKLCFNPKDIKTIDDLIEATVNKPYRILFEEMDKEDK